VCRQCGGDLKDAEARQAGQVVGAFSTKPPGKVKCPNCGTDNADTALRCQNCGASLSPQTQDPKPAPVIAKKPNLVPVFIIAGVLALCGLVALVYYLTRPAAAVTGVVIASNWQRAIPIEALVPVEHLGWQDEIPAEAELGACTQELRSVENEPVPESVEVCGTPYTVDTGTGIGEVVQDCQYEVYDDYCRYTVDEWQVVDQAVASGEGFNPQWPVMALQAGQRALEQRQETYTLVFEADGERYTFNTSDFALWQQAQSDEEWQLTFNRLGSLVQVEP
jgi:hypothetical protein